MLIRSVCCLATVLGPASCSPPVDEPAQEERSAARDPTAPIRTNAASYVLVRDTLGWGTEIRYQFRNVTPDTLYAVNCNGATSVAVERRDPAGWTTFWAPIVNGCLSPPITIPPGDSVSAPLLLWGAPPGTNVGPQFGDTTFTGVYRLLWWNLLAHYDPNRRGELGDSVPVRYRYSNGFTLEVRR